MEHINNDTYKDKDKYRQHRDMTFSTLMQWFFIFGTLTMIIGIIRYVLNKQTAEPDELTVLSWFFCWWVWLPYLVIRQLYLFHRNAKRKRKAVIVVADTEVDENLVTERHDL